ncbi:4-alpha-L-fucosyltransferase (Fuc4NAc transferase) [Methylophaga frappieri]|uniref:4-alpha-L-fucosyltransferase (Fuc4NAc transferase) n=1 Tax=Methylophaga frappieri (strain ATCC BAA-2434 / DSM 25690 / JAM7) TaxID=754477 RepID=I1YG62_METFJ|nr:TDP-N-acetylfucosamine:lipid II N-acetylfucosaminyltransferase [Methylophaga frappieri]AFJ01905.1 4-alpha-L-fucosyltransferase (Fuc4NAc transferase) [Methylophaga frappieri]
MTTLHIIHNDKFIPQFIDFMKSEYDDFEQHIFYIFDREEHYPLPGYSNIIFGSRFGTIGKYTKLRQHIISSDKVIIHFLASMKVILFLNIHTSYLKKICWVLWGIDLYRREQGKRNFKWYVREFLRKRVFKNLGAVTTTVPGDFLLAKKWYDTRAVYIENLMYPSHVNRDIKARITSDATRLNIQIGNSASPTNNHKEIIDKLSKEVAKDFRVYCPLSYGNETYKAEIIEYGYSKLGEKFVPMTEFMSFDEYTIYLNGIDIAIMNHDRQQAMGNIIALLGMGKKLYIRSDITPWSYFQAKGVTLFDSLANIELKPIEHETASQNIARVAYFFTRERLKKNWDEVFESQWNLR